MTQSRIGIDLGGTKIEGIVLTADGEIQRRLRVQTPAAEGYEAIIEAIASLVEELDGGGRTLPVGIGTPGSISARSSAIKNSNTVALNGRPLKTDLEHRLGRPIRLANDANCLALSEATDGAGAGADVVFGAILGTGVGGGWSVRGRILPGLQGIAGEWGHNPLEQSGPRCYCGRRGCVETLLSGPGFENDYRTHGGSTCSSIEIVDRMRSGEALAKATFERYIERLGRALATVINIVDPQVIVLGGGMSNVHEIYPRLPDALRPHVFNDESITPVRPAQHGDSSGVRGAAWLWPV
ncbi:MAG: ROK family protein [Myxococcota bacterium]